MRIRISIYIEKDSNFIDVIYSTRLRAKRVGAQYLIEEGDLTRAAVSGMLLLPPGWDRMAHGERTPDIVAALRRARAGR
jgi:hypothetical protein